MKFLIIMLLFTISYSVSNINGIWFNESGDVTITNKKVISYTNFKVTSHFGGLHSLTTIKCIQKIDSTENKNNEIKILYVTLDTIIKDEILNNYDLKFPTKIEIELIDKNNILINNNPYKRK